MRCSHCHEPIDTEDMLDDAAPMYSVCVTLTEVKTDDEDRSYVQQLDLNGALCSLCTHKAISEFGLSDEVHKKRAAAEQYAADVAGRRKFPRRRRF